MLERILKISNELDSSIFLFGGRQTGKTTILHQQFPKTIFIDLLNTSVKSRFRRTPSLLYDTLVDKPEDTLIIINARIQALRLMPLLVMQDLYD